MNQNDLVESFPPLFANSTMNFLLTSTATTSCFFTLMHPPRHPLHNFFHSTNVKAYLVFLHFFVNAYSAWKLLVLIQQWVIYSPAISHRFTLNEFQELVGGEREGRIGGTAASGSVWGRRLESETLCLDSTTWIRHYILTKRDRK